MSGIFGILRFDDAPVLPEDLERMSGAMHFYGEDGGGTWREGGIGVGSRLRHATPEDAFEDQPLAARGCALVFAGRLDYREELLESLGRHPGEDLPAPDSALVLEAFERWGTACVDHLSGDWAFAVWDAAAQRLLVARDHHGNTGLYWHRDGRRLAFATSQKALLALPDTPRRPDLFKVAQTLSAWLGDGIRTSHEGIQSLPPAHVLEASRAGVGTRRYWFPEAIGPRQDLGDEACLEQFLEVYGAAVRARLRSAKPIAATLSAGFDSGSLVALAGPVLAGQGRPLEAYTSVPRFEEPGSLPAHALGNEWALAHATATMAEVGVHLPVDAAGWPLLNSLQRQLHIHDGPGHSGANYHWMLALLELARDRGMGVLLTGQQGNAAVSYSGDASQWWPNLLRGRIREAWRGLAEAEPDPWLAFKRQVLKPILMPGIRAYQRRTGPPRRSWILDTAIRASLVEELDLEATMAQEGFDPAFQTSRHPMILVLLGLGQIAVGATWHELGAAHGLEVRDPTADRRVLEFCLRLPHSQFRRRGQERWLIRRAMEGKMAPEVLQAKVRGRQASDLGRRALEERGPLEEALARLRQHPLVDRCLDVPRMESLLRGLTPEKAFAAYADCGCILLRGLNAAMFLENF